MSNPAEAVWGLILTIVFMVTSGVRIGSPHSDAPRTVARIESEIYEVDNKIALLQAETFYWGKEKEISRLGKFRDSLLVEMINRAAHSKSNH